MEKKLERLHQAIDYLKGNGTIHTQQNIANALGIDRQRLSSALKGKVGKFTEGFIKRFAKAYSQYISEEWLLTGQGRMAALDRHHDRLHIPADRITVSAGYTNEPLSSIEAYDCDVVPVIDFLSDYDFTITVHGDSMEPLLDSDDVVACRWLDNDHAFKRDKVYVIDTTGGAVIKTIARVTSDGLVCHSLNKEYHDFIVPKEAVNRIALVVGLIRQL